jgi:hypothetical protein
VLVRGASDERARRALLRSEVFFPYFEMRVLFDNRLARVALRNAGLVLPALETYFDRLVHFALAAEWGRRRITRATASGRTAPRPAPAPYHRHRPEHHAPHSWGPALVE